jgi:hypothetical protein
MGGRDSTKKRATTQTKQLSFFSVLIEKYSQTSSKMRSQMAVETINFYTLNANYENRRTFSDEMYILV